MNQAVHSAMERCLVGEMVKLAFQVTHNRNSLPSPKCTQFNSTYKTPELLANGIYTVEAGDLRHNSIFSYVNEYLSSFEKTALSNVSNNESASSLKDSKWMEEKNGNIDTMLPRDLFCDSLNDTNFLFSLDYSSNTVEHKDGTSNISFDCTESPTLTRADDDVKDVRIEKSVFYLSDINQSVSYANDKNQPLVMTCLRLKHHRHISEVEGSPDLFISLKKSQDFNDDFPNTLKESGRKRKACDNIIFDSLFSEDFDAFIANISSSCFMTKSLKADDKSPSVDNTFYGVEDSMSQLTSTPCGVNNCIPFSRISNGIKCSPICFKSTPKSHLICSPHVRDMNPNRDGKKTSKNFQYCNSPK